MKKSMSFILILLVLGSAVFAAGGGEKTAAKITEIPMMFRNEGNDSGWQFNEKVIAMYNKKFEGKYAIKVEYVPGVAVDMRTKLKMLNQSKNLPAAVSDLGAETAFADLLIQNNRLVNLKPYFDASPDWQKFVLPQSVKYNTQANGAMYTGPQSSASYVGIFYNKELFAKAGISEFPKTWDAFWAACEKLKAAGIPALSLHTTETGWCPMLLGTSSYATSAEGMAFADKRYPTDYNNAAFTKVVETMKKAFTYSPSDSVGGNYSNAANNFASGKTAMIPNGPWMIGSLSDTQFAPAGFVEKVGYAPYPENVMLSWLARGYGQGVSVDHPKPVQEGAIEYVKFLETEEVLKLRQIMLGDICVKIKLSDEDKSKFNNVWNDYFKIAENLKTAVLVYQTQLDPTTQNEVIVNQLPQLIQGKITVAQFVDLCTKAATKWVAENKDK